ncbi:hypothetical protein Avbf_15295 [Armadillidium vulgare]|nr:hypothetical protein Avbf_15295 [Armadillidium vulgare]
MQMVSQRQTVSAFLKVFALCFRVTPCQVSFDTSGHEDLLKCYTKYDYNSIDYREASFHEFVGCIWFARINVPSTFWSMNDKCKEVGGQLVSFENFLNEEDFEAFFKEKGLGFFNVVGFIRDETSAEFKWVTGTTLRNDSFL